MCLRFVTAGHYRRYSQTSIAAFCSRYTAPAVIKGVEHALQHIRSRQLVDELRPSLARSVRRNQRARDGGGREPFIPKQDRQFGARREIPGEGTRRLGRGTFASVHVERQTH